MPALTMDMARQGLDVDHLLIDRAYINSALVDDVLSRRGKIVCKPWKSHNGSLFPKSAFTLNLRDRTIECPQGQTAAQCSALGANYQLSPNFGKAINKDAFQSPRTYRFGVGVRF